MSERSNDPQLDDEGGTESRSVATAADEGNPGSPWVPTAPHILRFADDAGVAEAAARRFVETARVSIRRTDSFIVVLSGGSTPRLLYSLLAQPPHRDAVAWDKTFLVFGDERCVPPDDQASNFRMVTETLLAGVDIPPHHVLRMKGEQAPPEAARRYEARLGDLFITRPRRQFDLVLLGIGTDGHTASLFPGTRALEEKDRWVVANHVPHLDSWRLTLTFRALNATRHVLFMATGENKARVVAEAFGGVEHDPPYPCERVAPPHVRREVLVDQRAASALPGGETSPSAEP